MTDIRVNKGKQRAKIEINASCEPVAVILRSYHNTSSGAVSQKKQNTCMPERKQRRKSAQ